MPTSFLEVLLEGIQSNHNNKDIDERHIRDHRYDIEHYLLIESEILDVHSGACEISI
jgi:hypothetical protein